MLFPNSGKRHVTLEEKLLGFISDLRDEAVDAEVWDGNNQAVIERIAYDLETLLKDS